jgi:hypothetical protein
LIRELFTVIVRGLVIIISVGRFDLLSAVTAVEIGFLVVDLYSYKSPIVTHVCLVHMVSFCLSTVMTKSLTVCQYGILGVTSGPSIGVPDKILA